MLRGDAVPLSRPFETHRLTDRRPPVGRTAEGADRRPPVRLVLRSGLLRRAASVSACAVLVATLAGCGAIERAGISLVVGDRDVAARALRSDVPTENAELSLVGAALRLVPASGRVRPSADGRAHFSTPGASFYGLRLLRRDGLGAGGAERWRLDGKWAVRELPDGVALCWEGDLRLVVETLGVVLSVNGSGAAGPRR
jgi:hypothetical protein